MADISLLLHGKEAREDEVVLQSDMLLEVGEELTQVLVHQAEGGTAVGGCGEVVCQLRDMLPGVAGIPHIIYMVRLGHWTTILPDASVMAVRGVVRLPLEETMLMPTHVLTLADAYQRKAVTEFLRILDESARVILQTADGDCDICSERFLG